MGSDTWLFFAGTTVVLAALCVVAWRTPRNVHPVPVDRSWQPIAGFYADRPDRTTEVDLGRGWSSVDDPGAAFELSWIRATGELVVLRHQAHPDLLMGAGLIAAVPMGTDDRATGMKVLAVVDLAELQALHPQRLRPEPDGLDRLTAALGTPYWRPHPEDPHWALPRPET